ncbi:hypothetical protein [Candidatus Skiveiella danica]|uniref:hypothetical protein n=1 Tax=Candidatus Skiveiella danica TaxID=3386177 RepID=UPI0039B9BFF6
MPDWRVNAQAASERATSAYLAGNTRVANLEFDRMRKEVARTGDAGLMARAELLRCSTQVASLVFEPCSGFEALRADAAAPRDCLRELPGRSVCRRRSSPLLPNAQQPAAQRLLQGGAISSGDAALLPAMDQPLPRLVAAALWFQAGQGHPAVITLAVDTASSQGWSRPLLAWLQVQARHAESAGDAVEARRVRRRIELVLNGGALPPAAPSKPAAP